MRRATQQSISAAGVLSAAVLCLAGCAATAQPHAYRSFFAPPLPVATASEAEEPMPDPPGFGLYVNEMPSLPVSLPHITRPSETEFVLRQADAYFINGKRAIQEGRLVDGRHDFDRAIQVLLNAPETLADRGRIETRLDQLVDAIYKYDLDQMASAEGDEQFEKRPLDDILEMTFPVDPGLRSKVKKEIQGTGSQLPLEESDAVVSFIHFFSSTRGKKILESGMRRSGRYKEMIERVLAEEGVPQELIFLAQAESGFYPRAISRAKCVGLWQFAQFRGREYGLMQTATTDDRMDPEQATRAAARHLHDLYNHFGDWYLSMAAYNCGPGCVDAAIQRTGYADFWTLRRMGALPQETANYVPAILAMTIIAKNAGDYGLEVEYEPALEYETLELPSVTHLALAAAAIDRPVSELRELNPALMRNMAPAHYSLHVPKGTLPLVEAAFQTIPTEQRDAWRIHKVETGDTLASVAKRYGASSTALASANNGDLPAEGSWAAIPVSYPVDRVVTAKAAPARKTVASSKKPAVATKAVPGTAKTRLVASSAKPTASKPAASKPAASKSTASRPAASKLPARVALKPVPRQVAANRPGSR